MEDILKDVEAADKVLVGIGLEWEEKADNSHYEKLKAILEDKDYYIITLCTDDVIYEVFGEDERIVAPCGTHRWMQCDMHIVSLDEAKHLDGKYYCPVCGKEMDYNTVKNPEYIEEGYLPRFAEYKKWLMSTINKKLCMIELGAGMQYPSVIRFAFDKTFFYNKKASFYRINESFYQMTSENGDRGVSINANSLDYIRNL